MDNKPSPSENQPTSLIPEPLFNDEGAPLSHGKKLPFFEKISLWEEPVIFRALRHGLMLTLPLLLAAAIALLVNNFPLAGYAALMEQLFGPNWRMPGVLLYNCSTGMISLVVAYNLSSSLIDWHNSTKRNSMPVSTVLGSGVVLCWLFIILTPNIDGRTLIVSWVGIAGLFGTYLITLLACAVFLWLHAIPALSVHYYSEDSDPLLPQIFTSIIPALLTIFLFLAFKYILASVGITNIHQAIHGTIVSLFRGGKNSLGLGYVYTFLVQLSWLFGVHGANFFDPVTHDIFAKGLELNVKAVQAGEPVPYVITKYLFDQFLYLGGSGATLALVAAIFIKGKNSVNRRIVSIFLLPGLFNINELIIFGLPIAFNPVYFIPFILAPMAMLTTSYLAVKFQIAPPPVYHVDWTTPIFINAWLSTKSIAGVILQLINFIIATLIYMPFVAYAEKRRLRSHHRAFKQLISVAENGVKNAWGKNAIDRKDSAGSLARALANELVTSLNSDGGNGISLHFQPRVDMVKKSVPSVEVLLRWEHPIYGLIPSVVAFCVAEDAEVADKLDTYVMKMAMQQCRAWQRKGILTPISINLSERQLNKPEFPKLFGGMLMKYELEPDAIRLEVKESLALNPQNPYGTILRQLKQMRAYISIDAFGHNYQSLALLRELPISELQIDKPLVRDMFTNKVYQDVIATIQERSIALKIKTTAEYVETPEQLETLLELNLTTFQGQLFSRPTSAEQCEAFIASFGK